MKRPFSSRNRFSGPFVRVNGKIRAREVRVIGGDGSQLGVRPIGEALNMAKQQGVDLVEVAAQANPPVCRLVDYGKYRYEQSKKGKEHKKHQHATKVKEIQLSPTIDPHDAEIKLAHAIDFLCQDMKVKITLRFKGRQMAHQEYGFQKVEDFIQQVAPYGHPDAPIRQVGRGINVMVSPHPRNKRAKNPHEGKLSEAGVTATQPSQPASEPKSEHVPTNAAEEPSGFSQNPFADLKVNAKE